MKKIFVILLALAVALPLSAQDQKRLAPAVQTLDVQYQCFENGEPTTNNIVLNATWEQTIVKYPNDEVMVMDYENGIYQDLVEFRGETLAVNHHFKLGEGLKLISENSQTLFSWHCNVYRSEDGRVELWATANPGFSGTPAPEYGVVEGVVLRIIVDGQTVIDAVKFNRSIHPPQVNIPENIKVVSPTVFNSAVICNQLDKHYN